MKRRKESLSGIVLCSMLVALASCSDGPGPNPDACPQTFEFGNYGCARVQGTVRNSAGQPIAGARMSLVPSEGDNAYDFPIFDTDATGFYSLEIHRFGLPAITTADTVPMYLRALLLRNGLPIGDSIIVQTIFVPVDAVPEVVAADITLD
jgi:hypothetical protein